MTPTVAELERAHWIGPADAALARSLARLAAVDAASEAALAIALASQQVRAGHVCVDLASPPAVEELDGEAPSDGERPAWIWPAPDAWRAALEASELVAPASSWTPEAGARRPLILDEAGRLYLSRYFEHERRLARALLARAEQGDIAPDGVDEARLAEGLDRIFGAARADESDAQRRAAEVAVRRRLCVITGGPGTGKTSAVAGVLVLAVDQALAAGRPAPRIMLVAPTGKAAAALTASLERALGGIDCDDVVRAAIPAEATTVHRALGSLGGVGARFRHGAEAPWAADLVVLDEASMVDLSLMRRLVDAVPAHARLVMMGDADQLASVEAGAVLGEICGADAGGDDSGPLAGHIVRLVKSHRFAEDSGVGALARAINDGDAASALDVLGDDGLADVTRVEGEGADPWPPEIERIVRDGYAPFLGATDPASALAALERFRVLCPMRAGPRGVEAFNRRLARLRRDGDAALEAVPILIERNDYSVELFNGDIGLIARADDPDAIGRAYFAGRGGELRTLSDLRLPAHSPCWAMSVHKSQGSEFDEVLVVLPDRPSPLLTREMLYTAITRARRRVVIWGDEERLVECIERRVERRSGLRDALWGGSGADRPGALPGTAVSEEP